MLGKEIVLEECAMNQKVSHYIYYIIGIKGCLVPITLDNGNKVKIMRLSAYGLYIIEILWSSRLRSIGNPKTDATELTYSK